MEVILKEKNAAKLLTSINLSKNIFPLSSIQEKIATRDAYGKELCKLGSEKENIVVLDADLSGSTRTGWFGKKFPERFFNAGIAEQNLIGLAAGLSLGGKIPFVSSFAIFLTGRPWEIIRQSVCYPNLNVKLVASHSGLTVGEDGASHQSLEDIALMRILPNMQVLIPADGTQAGQMVRYAAQTHGPVYIRTSRPSSSLIYKPGYKFDPWIPDELVYGKDVLIITAGLLVSEALKACEKLAEDGYYPGVLNLHTLKPANEEAIAGIVAKYKTALIFEEHSKYGGLGAMVTQILSAHHPMKVFCYGVETFGKSGSPRKLLEEFELDACGIAGKVIRIYKN